MANLFNGSGCKDTTAHKAIKNISAEDHEIDKRAHDAIKLAKDLIRICGFDLINRIAIKDKETGREYR